MTTLVAPRSRPKRMRAVKTVAAALDAASDAPSLSPALGDRNWSTIPLLWAFAFAASAAGKFSPSMEFVFMAVSLAFASLLLLKKAAYPLLGLLVLLATVKLLPPGSTRWALMWQAFASIAAVAGLYAARNRSPERRGQPALPELVLLTHYAILGGLLLLFDAAVLANPYLRPTLDSALRRASEVLTATATGESLPLGTTYWSLPVLLAYSYLCLIQPARRKRLLAAAYGFAALVMYFQAVAYLQKYSLASPAPTSLNEWYARDSQQFQGASQPLTLAYFLRWLVFDRTQLILLVFLSAGLLLAGVRRGSWAVTRQSVPLGTFAGVRIAAAGLTVGVLLYFVTKPAVGDQASLRDRKTLVYTKHLDNMVPAHGAYGDRSLGMFGMLPTMCRELGLDARETTDIQQLADDDELLVMANLQAFFLPEEKKRILDWVSAGGGLLIVTDHTGDASLRLPVDDLTGDHGILLNYDTAKVGRDDGASDYEMLLGSPLVSLKDVRSRNSAGYGTGASLSVRYPAVPIVQARYAFSEAGSFTASDRGGVGNLTYDLGESFGDAALGAMTSVGRGRIIVFGDTASFQNASWTDSSYFCVNVFNKLLASSGDRDMPPLAACAAVGFVFLLAGGALALGHSRRTVLIGMVSMNAAWAGLLLVNAEQPEPVAMRSAKQAILHPGSLPYTGHQGWTGTDTGGLEACLIRDGYIPLKTNSALPEQLAVLKKGDALFLVAPLAEIPASDAAAIDSFLKAGGQVVVNCGFEEAAGINKLLKDYGVPVTDVPLGATPANELRSNPRLVKFLNAWQVGGMGQILATLKGRPVALKKAIGEGTLTVIGDSKFFWNANLEDREVHLPGNISFLSSLLSAGDSHRPRS